MREIKFRAWENEGGIMTQGGSAFPEYSYNSNFERMTAKGGLTKREWFAGTCNIPWEMLDKILTATFGDGQVDIKTLIKVIASVKYEYADAMLKAGEGKNDLLR